MTDTTPQRQRLVVALPKKIADLPAFTGKPVKEKRFSDRVGVLADDLYDSEDEQGELFRTLLAAGYDVDSMEGTIRDDEARSALELRQYAATKGDSVVASAQLADVRAGLRIWRNKQGLSRLANKRRRDAADEIDQSNDPAE